MQEALTTALAYSNPPPIGANIIPIMKKSGRTVFGVRIGLDFRPGQQNSLCTRFAILSLLTAMLSVAVGEMQYLRHRNHQSALDLECHNAIYIRGCSLAGLLVFFFSSGFKCGSCELMESGCSSGG